MNGMAVCAGIAGLELGIKLATQYLGIEYRCVVYVEREAFAASALVARMAGASLGQAPVWDDVKTFDGKPWRGVVDIVTGGYPCQPFSVAGRKRGKDDPRHLWPSIKRIVKETQPEWCFFENVGNHLRLGFREVKSELEGLHYRVEAGLFSAEAVGAPHIRERLFILAHRTSGGLQGPLARMVESSKAARGERSTQAMRVEGLRGDVADRDHQGQSVHECGEQREVRGRPYPLSREVSPTSRADGASGEVIARSGGSLPIFPPGPADRDTWQAILREWPQVEPSICRMADGATPGLDATRYRDDRLRGLGNAVVPLTAAFAFVVLWRRFEVSE